MDAPRDDDPDDVRPMAHDDDDRREARRGPHLRQHDDGGPPRVADYLREGSVADLREALKDLRVGENAPAPPVKPKLDLSLNIPTIVMLGGMLLAGMQGWINLNERIAAAERGVQDGRDRATRYVPIIEAIRETVQGQAAENKMQNDRINSVVDSLADERRARNADGVESRKAQQDIMSLIAKLADKVSDIGTDVAVIKAGGRRSDLGNTEREAQAQGPISRPR